MYNLTNITNSSTVLEFAQSVQSDILDGYYFGWFVLIIIFFVIFMGLKYKGYTSEACFAVGCWIVTIMVFFLRPMELIDNYTFWVGILLTPISVFILYMSGTGME